MTDLNNSKVYSVSLLLFKQSSTCKASCLCRLKYPTSEKSGYTVRQVSLTLKWKIIQLEDCLCFNTQIKVHKVDITTVF